METASAMGCDIVCSTSVASDRSWYLCLYIYIYLYSFFFLKHVSVVCQPKDLASRLPNAEEVWLQVLSPVAQRPSTLSQVSSGVEVPGLCGGCLEQRCEGSGRRKVFERCRVLASKVFRGFEVFFFFFKLNRF